MTPVNGVSTNDSTPTVSGTAQASSTVRVYLDGSGTATCTTTASAGGTWSCDVSSALGAGSHSVRATATNLGGTSAQSNTNTFTVDVTAPAVPVITSPINGSSTNDTTPTVSGAAEANLALSVERAAKVAQELAAVAPDLSPAQMPVVEGFGEALPMACDETAIGRQLNRRVELWVVPDFAPTGTEPVLAAAP